MQTPVRTLDELCAALGYGEQQVATAVNGDFVAREARAARVLSDQDKVEIVSPRQGG